MKKVFFEWLEVDDAADFIIKELKGIKIDLVAGIPRGGLILAVILSHKLDVPLVLDPLLYSDKRILIVDDISDTGKTFLSLLDKIDPRERAYRPITATIHFKPSSRFAPDIYYKETEDWIVYPWETPETSKIDYKESSVQL